MTDNILQIAYLSKRKHDVTDEDIVDGIVLPSLAKNRSLGITGCLWFDRTHFFQVLEGTPEAIENLFAVIATDDRHESVDRILTEDTGGVRRFERFGLRAADSQAARSMPELIEAYHKQASAQAPRPNRWRDLAYWARATFVESADEGLSFGDLTRTIIGQLADWSQATPAR